MRIATHSLAILSTFLCIETVSAQSAKLSAETDCRAGCQGNKSGCQESGQAAIIAADKGMRLYKESLTISRFGVEAIQHHLPQIHSGKSSSFLTMILAPYL